MAAPLPVHLHTVSDQLQESMQALASLGALDTTPPAAESSPEAETDVLIERIREQGLDAWRYQQQARLANLADALHQSINLAVYRFSQEGQMLFLTILTGDQVVPAIDLNIDLRHFFQL